MNSTQRMSATGLYEPVEACGRTHGWRHPGAAQLNRRRYPERQLREVKLTPVVLLHVLAAQTPGPARCDGPELTPLLKVCGPACPSQRRLSFTH